MKLVTRPSASTVLVTYLTTRFLAAAASSSWRRYPYAALVPRLVAFVFILNWRNWPFVWHASVWSTVLSLRLRLLRYGPSKCLSIGQSPFKRMTVMRNVRNGWYLSDWNMHMSNSSYARILDKARFAYMLELFGPAMGREQVVCPLGSTTFAFYDEIPVGADFDVEMDTISWDDKWIYYRAAFVTSSKKDRKSGEQRVRRVNAVALNKTCFKIRGSGLSIPPEAVLAIAGVGEDAKNWDRATQLRQSGKAKKWLRYRGTRAAQRAGKAVRQQVEREADWWDEDPLEQYEDERKRRLEQVAFLGSADGWKEL